jgi:DNA-binding cell septation regulator SpoVG
MDIRTIWQTKSKYPQFNLEIASAPGAEAFLVVKGCKIANGSNGQFVSGPSTKGQDGKYWNHTYLNDKFSAAVLKIALDTQPYEEPQEPAFKKPSQDGARSRQLAPQRGNSGGFEDMDSDIPFRNPMRGARCLVM